MLGIPKRISRLIAYASVICVLMFMFSLFLGDNKMSSIQKYLPKNLTPSFFQPPSDVYVLDLRIKGCYGIANKGEKCVVSDEGSAVIKSKATWEKIDKDLRLGNSWYKKEFLSYQKIKAQDYYGRDEGKDSSAQDLPDVLIDIAVYNPSVDSKYKGNSHRQIPLKILKEFHSKRIFDDKDLQEQRETAEGLNAKVEPVKERREAMDTIEKVNNKIEKKDVPDKETTSGTPDPLDDKKDTQVLAFNEEGSHESNNGNINNDVSVLNYKIPSTEHLSEEGWSYKSHGIWTKFGKPARDAITGIDILFGDDAVEPRPNWNLIESPLQGLNTNSDRQAYITYRKGPKIDYKSKKYAPSLKFNENGKFKILQVADLHFSTGVGKCRDSVNVPKGEECKADPRTLKFLEAVLDLEKPDFVVLTGDQIFGDEAPDSETAIFKALNPFIKLGIPFAVTLGNHDDEGSINRKEVMALCSNLPYSLAELGLDEVPGFGNYVLKVEDNKSKKIAMTMYFLDTHKYSKNPKVNPGYDWLKDSQLSWMSDQASTLKTSSQLLPEKHLSMAFFHIPIPEYRNLNQPYIGEQREGVTAPRYNTGARKIFGEIGIQFVSVGHDHCNDYCLQDTTNIDSQENKLWLCYGGGSGEGGYGGYNNYVRRLRIFDVDLNSAQVQTWKRSQDDVNKVIDHQTIVTEGEVVNFA